MRQFACVICLAGTGCFYCMSAAAAEPADTKVVLDLEQCIAEAYGNHPRMVQAKASSRAAKARKSQARAGYLPRIDAEARWQRLDEEPSIDVGLPNSLREAMIDAAAMNLYARTVGDLGSAFPGGGLPANALYTSIRDAVEAQAPGAVRVPLSGREVRTAAVTLRQPLFTGGKIHHRNRQAALGVELAREGEDLTRHTLKLEVTRAYYGVALGKDLIDVAESSRKRLQVIVDITGDLYKVSHRATEMDFLKARINLSKTEAVVALANKYHQLALVQLKEAMGMELGTPLDIHAEHLVARPQRRLVAGQCVTEALGSRAELRQAQLAARVEQSGVSLARAEYAPDISLFVRFHHISDNEGYRNPNDENQWVGGICGTLPIFSGFSRPAKVREARSRLRRAEARAHEVRQLIALEVRAALLEVDEKRESREAARRAMDDAIARNELAKSGYRHDMVDVEDMIDAQFEELEARAAYLQAVYHYNVADAYVVKVLCR